MKRRQIALILFGLLGFLAMFWSANDWYELMRGDRMQASFCSINSYWNCDRASLSPWGSIGLVPLGIFGALWFWVVVILAFGSGVLRSILKPLVVLGLVSISLLAVYLFGYLRTGCIVCYFSYLCLVVVAVSAWHSSRFEKLRMGAGLTHGLLAVGILILGLFSFSNAYKMDRQINEAEFRKWYESLPMEVAPEISNLTKGMKDAKIKVIEFSDFGCPVCERAASILNPYLSSQPDVQVMYYPFPLDSDCNPLMQRRMHPYSCDWAKGSLCAAEQNQFWPFHDRVFKYAAEFGQLANLEQEISNFGLEMTAFNACMAKPETQTRLRQLIEVGSQLNLKSTPTFFVNGRRIEGFIPLPLLRRLILELRRPPV